MVLAAGRGSRLRPLTDTCPKTMVPIAGQPLLAHVIRLLASHGFDRLLVNLHHLPEQIRAYFGRGVAWKVHIDYSFEPQLLGTAGAVRQVAGFFADAPFLVYYGDNLTNFNLTDLWQAHYRQGALASIGLLKMDQPTTRGIVGLNSRSHINRLIEKPSIDQVFPGYLVNTGTYILDPAILDQIPPDRPCDFARDVFPRLLACGVPLYGHRMSGQLLSTDTPERYEFARQCVDSGVFVLP